MGRQAIKELHTDDIKTEQKADLNLDTMDRGDGDVVLVEKMPSKEYADELAFMEEPVTIRLAPSTDKNASNVFPAWVNGDKPKVLINGKWLPTNGYLPIGQNITIQRKVLEVVLRAKIDRVETQVGDATTDHPENRVSRFTTPVHSVSIIEDKNPRGAVWASELIRRNY